MVEIFKDESVIECAIKVVMVNSSGKLELGVDNRGVFRDALSAFWSLFYHSCTVGEQKRMPVVRQDFQILEWTAIARIFVKGYKDANVFPIKLSKVFICTVLFNEEVITNDLMLESFLSYISSDEKDLVTEALNNDELSEEQNEEWEKFLERFGSPKIPKFKQRFDVIPTSQARVSTYARHWDKDPGSGWSRDTPKSGILLISDLYFIKDGW